ncbi:MAG: hypothetical protein R2862_09005 [Thermoanaerobaculia bacterium]
MKRYLARLFTESRSQVAGTIFATFGTFIAYQVIVVGLMKIGILDVASIQKYLTTREYRSLAIQPARDLLVALLAGVAVALFLAVRDRGRWAASAVRAGLGVLLGLALCLGQSLYVALLYRGSVPSFGMRANGWVQGLIYVVLATVLAYLAIRLFDVVAGRSSSVQQR